MTKYAACALLIFLVQTAFADEVKPADLPASSEVQAMDDQSRDPAMEKSFFETRTYDDMVNKIQSLSVDSIQTSGG